MQGFDRLNKLKQKLHNYKTKTIYIYIYVFAKLIKQLDTACES